MAASTANMLFVFPRLSHYIDDTTLHTFGLRTSEAVDNISQAGSGTDPEPRSPTAFFYI